MLPYLSEQVLSKAVLIELPRRGFFQITDRGIKVLGEKNEKINIRYLYRFSEFMKFRAQPAEDQPIGPTTDTPAGTNEKTPEELIDYAYELMHRDLVDNVKTKLLECSPTYFEKLVVEVLLGMGYGGSRKDAGEQVGRSGDGGIDGIIKEDRLGLDVIYIQAKKWDNTVGRPEIQKFVGALQGQKASKGVFITTSNFSKEAQEYAKTVQSKVVLIDGEQLANLMIDYGIGVSRVTSYELKRIDSDYFLEE